MYSNRNCMYVSHESTRPSLPSQQGDSSAVQALRSGVLVYYSVGTPRVAPAGQYRKEFDPSPRRS